MSAFTAAFADLEPRERYKLLCASVTPRPIALVTTLSSEGVVNAAPFSFFNVFSEDPALIVLGLQHKPGNNPKDTTRNIAAAGEFVVNLVDESLAEAMNVCAVDFPPEVSEIDAAGLSLLPGVSIPVPRIAQAPFALECRKTVSMAFTPTRELLIGEVVRIHAREGLVDPATLRVSMSDYKPVGRMFGDGYSRQGDRFDMRRGSYAEWLAKKA
ncbi:MAG TPA: flavin reductase family protein [Bosea sp. (in: a-proteobacteria)]